MTTPPRDFDNDLSQLHIAGDASDDFRFKLTRMQLHRLLRTAADGAMAKDDPCEVERDFGVISLMLSKATAIDTLRQGQR